METVEIGGKQFVSAKAAARAHGYTMDYIGQLIRAGKLVGSKIGRAWYVEIESLATYTGDQKFDVAAVSAPAPAEVVAEVVKPEPVPVSRQPVSSAIKPSIREMREVNEVFGMRYLTDEEPMLPQLSTKVASEPSEAEEHAVSVRAIHAPMYTPPTVKETRQEVSEVVKKVAPTAQVSPVQLRPLQKALPIPLSKVGMVAACALLLIFAVSGIFLERTVSVEGERQTAGVSFSR